MKRGKQQRTTNRQRNVAGAHRSRESQHKQNVMHSMIAGGMPPQGGANELIEEELQTKPDEHDALHDSVEPPPPQLRRARSTSDPSKAVKDKNRGIKGRDATGKKHTPTERRQHKTSR